MGAIRTIASLLFTIALSGSYLLAGEMVAGKGFPVGTAASAKGPLSSAAARPGAESAPALSSMTPVSVVSTPAPVGATAAVPGVMAPASAAYESQPIAFSSSDRRRTRADGQERSYGLPSIWPALFAVAVVCGFFCTALWLVKKYVPGHKQLFNHPAIEVLGRTHLDQRRYVSLLRVGKRIVVVGVSPDEIRSLTEISEEAEVTEILEIARPKTEAGLSIFQRLFQKNMVKAEAEETRALADAQAEQLTEQMAALREQVKRIKKSGVTAAKRSTGTATAGTSVRGAAASHIDTVG